MIRYRKGAKYQLIDADPFQTDVRPDHPIETRFVVLEPSGLLTLHPGFAWNGSSGPAIDTRNSMQASAVHDALYDLFNAGHLSVSRWLASADQVYAQIAVRDGMSVARANWQHWALKRFGEAYATQRARIYEAP